MAFLQVDLAAVANNIKDYTAEGPVIPVLKDNAYGLGALEVLETLKAEGIILFACSKPEEALSLAGHGADILLLSCVHEEELLRQLTNCGVILALESLSQAALLDSFGIPVRVHLAVDTGFGRFGFTKNQTEEMKQVFSLQNVKVEGIFSHFRSPDAAPEQFAVFQSVLSALEGYPVGIRHIAATLNAKNPAYKLDAVRIGTGYTGVLDGQTRSAKLYGTISTVRNLPAGSRIGYTSTKLKKDTTVAIIDVGTADGAFVYRSCGPRTWLAMRKLTVGLGEYRPRVLGTPGLTHTAIDVTGIPCKPGDTVAVAQTPVLISPAVPRKYI